MDANLTNITTNSVDVAYEVLTVLDTVSRSAALLISLVYILVLIFSSSLHKRAFVLLNHAVVANSFYEAIAFAYLFGTRPSFANEELNAFLCSVSELFWAFSVFIKAYSMLVLAVYRYVATFHIGLFKRINQSDLVLAGLIAAAYAVSILLPVIGKYAFGTTSSSVYCLDGSSDSMLSTLLYIFYVYTFLILIPVPLVVFIYVRIIRKLGQLAGSLGAADETTQGTAHTEAHRDLHSHDKQHKFVHQMIAMCVSLVASSFVLVVYQLRSIPDYFVIFYYWRAPLRCYLNAALSIVPITCLYYHPSRHLIWQRTQNFFKNYKVHSIN